MIIQVYSSARLDPLLEKVFVIRITTGTQCDRRLPELARVWIDKDWYQPIGLGQLVNEF